MRGLALRVRGIILLPALLLMLVLPGLTGIPVPGGAERPLAFFVAIAALLVFLWLDERKSWQLAAAAILLSGAFLTKREGLLLGACVIVAAGAASWADRRWAWPRLAVLGAAAFVLALPWRAWVAVEGYRSDSPEGGFFAFLDDFDRARDSLWLAVTGTTSGSCFPSPRSSPLLSPSSPVPGEEPCSPWCSSARRWLRMPGSR